MKGLYQNFSLCIKREQSGIVSVSKGTVAQISVAKIDLVTKDYVNFKILTKPPHFIPVTCLFPATLITGCYCLFIYVSFLPFLYWKANWKRKLIFMKSLETNNHDGIICPFTMSQRYQIETMMWPWRSRSLSGPSSQLALHGKALLSLSLTVYN